jgi:hypothetical protein
MLASTCGMNCASLKSYTETHLNFSASNISVDISYNRYCYRYVVSNDGYKRTPSVICLYNKETGMAQLIKNEERCNL